MQLQKMTYQIENRILVGGIHLTIKLNIHASW